MLPINNKEKTTNFHTFQSGFEKLSDFVSKIVGSPIWFFMSLVIVLAWLPSRFLFETEELWHLFINTFTTIFTFLMMSLLHSSQSKWERQMERMEKKQEKTLKILEKATEEIITDLGNPVSNTETGKEVAKDKNNKTYINSLL